MATISINVPAAAVDRVVHALCKSIGETDETAANAKAALIAHIKATVRNIEEAEAWAAALAALAEPDVDTVAD